MICITLSAETNDRMFELVRQAGSEPADMIELRLDSLRELPLVEELIAACPRQVIATCRSRREGGLFDGNDDARRGILSRALKSGADMIDAEAADIRFLAPDKGRAVLIASMHDWAGTPEKLPKRIAELAELPCDWVKFAVTHRRPADNATVLEAIGTSQKPCIGLAMGEEGLVTRILGLAYGSRIAYGRPAAERAGSHGLPTVHDLAHTYRVKELTRDTRVYGLLGDPVAQSRGYILHNRAFAHIEFDGVYIPFRSKSAVEFLNVIPKAVNLHGLSVTIPHKPAALKWSRIRSEAAERIGAANTLTLTPDGWRADNTDLPAVFESIKAVTDANAVNLTGEPALVLGSGGTTRAVGVALTMLGCKVTLAARNQDKAWNIAAVMDWDVEELPDAARGSWKVVANTTPVGMYPDIDNSLFPAEAWRPGMLAFESIHNPPRTRFLRDAEAAGALTVDGIEMFVRQAAEQFSIWTGRAMPKITSLT